MLGDKSELFCDYYSVSSTGNWEGTNILFITQKKEDLVKKYQIDEETFDRIINESKKILFDERNKRVRPGLDDKILTSWNVLMIKGYIDAYFAFGEDEFLAPAIKNGEFILKNMMDEDGRLNRNYKNGKSTTCPPDDFGRRVNAFLDDYAYTIEALISLYEATFDEKWIYAAKKLVDYVILHFSDSESSMFFYTSDIDEPLISRKIDFSDNVIPSSNSSFAVGLIKLSKLFVGEDYEERALKLINSINQFAIQNPTFHSYWLLAATYFVYPFYEVGIVGSEYFKKRKDLAKKYLPNIILFGTRERGNLEILKERFVKDKTLIYVCEKGACQLPEEKLESVIKKLKN